MSGRGRSALVVTLILALSLAVAMASGAEAKKGGKSKTFEASKAVSLAIPPEVVGVPSTPVTVDISVPKKFKKKVVGDVNATVQTTGLQPGAADDLIAVLSAPNGRSIELFDSIGEQNIGPLTLDDDTRTLYCDQAAVPCADPFATLLRPFAGTAAGEDGGFGYVRLSEFNGVKMRGTWTLTIWDEQTVGTDSVLNLFGLRIKPAKPVAE